MMRAAVPRIFRPFARYWRLSDRQARQFWSALAGATYSQPSAWRQQLLLFQDTPLGTAGHLIDEVSSPAVVIAVLESLIHEGRLRASAARQIEERVLRRTDHQGRWKETLADGRQMSHNGDR